MGNHLFSAQLQDGERRSGPVASGGAVGTCCIARLLWKRVVRPSAASGAQEEGYRGDSDVWRELLLRPAARDGVCRGDLPLHPVTRKGGGREGGRRHWGRRADRVPEASTGSWALEEY